MNRLDEIESRLEAATPGPWEAYGTVVAAMTGPGDCEGCSGVVGGPLHEPSCLWSEIAGAGEADAELIAHAPADLAALLAVVREVARLHQPIPDGMGFIDGSYGTISPACGTCGAYDEYAVPWPCPTARALQALTESKERNHEV